MFDYPSPDAKSASSPKRKKSVNASRALTKPELLNMGDPESSAIRSGTQGKPLPISLDFDQVEFVFKW